MTDATPAPDTAAEESAINLPNITLDSLKDIDSSVIVSRFEGFETALIELSMTWGVRLIAAILILIIGWSLGSWIRGRFAKMRRLDNTLKDFLGGFAKYAIITVSVITVIGLFGIPMASLLAVLGAAGLAIGLALQGTLANVASGVMLLILRPFNVGDYITWNGQGGTVKSLGLFGTELAMPDNVYVFAPNSKIWGTEIANYSRNSLRRQDIIVGIDYRDDLNTAMSVMMEIVNSDERILQSPEDKKPQILADKLNDFTVDIIVRFWSANADYWNLRWDINKRLKEELAAKGIDLALTPRQLAVGDGQ